MVSAAMSAVGIVCPEFGLVMEEPAGELPMGAPLCATTRQYDDLTMALGGDPSCVRIARDHTAEVMAAWRLSGHIPNATLVVSELVTNALCHALPAVDTVIGDPILLRLVRRRQDVLCLVGDPSDRPPLLSDAGFPAETGRGLHLVAAYSRHWDWTRRRHRPGKWVWALLQHPADARR
jgi:anti-sigma regulatory factor (Ser/Thr protein kinase)